MASLMKPGELDRLDRFRPVRVEHFQEVAKALALGLEAKLLVFLQALRGRAPASLLKVMLYRPRFGAEVAFLGLAIEMAALDVIERGGAERQRRLRRVACCRG